MQWNLDKSRPVCPQICEQLCVHIANGELPPNSRLLSVREIAVSAGVNPNTVQKSLEQLESHGVIYSVRGSGWFVKEDVEIAKQTVLHMAADKTHSYIRDMNTLGFDLEKTKKYIEEWEQ